MRPWITLLATTLFLAGCASDAVNLQTQQQALVASVPTTAAQKQRLLPADPELTSVFFFVPSLERSDGLSVMMQGRPANLRITLNGETIAIVPVKHGLRLDLLPNQYYQFGLGEDWEDQKFWMRLQTSMATLTTGTFKAFDVYSENSDGVSVALERLDVADTLARLDSLPLVAPSVAIDTIVAGASSIAQQADACVAQDLLAPCQQLAATVPARYLPARVSEHIARLEQAQQQKQALLALEDQLPASVRRDKYMVQLSRALKNQDYSQALQLFPKLEALPVAADPSLKFFYGEALLASGQAAPALQKLYQYINEQGSGATHYARALELINQAEQQL